MNGKRHAWSATRAPGRRKVQTQAFDHTPYKSQAPRNPDRSSEAIQVGAVELAPLDVLME